MHLVNVIESLDLVVLTDPRDFNEVEVNGGYCSDLLSCVMTGAQPGIIWVTVIANMNIVAVASLLEIPAIIITEGALPDEATIRKANQEGIVLLSTSTPSYQVIGNLWELGLTSPD